MQAGKPAKLERAALKPAAPGFPWRTFLSSLFARLDADDVVGLSAQVSYYFSLALFPFLIFLAALVGVLPFTHAWDGILAWITHYLPPEVQTIAFDAVASLTQSRRQFLSLGLVGSIWAASGGLTTLMSALNAAYQVTETRSYWKRIGLAVLLLFVLATLLIATFGFLSAGHALDIFVAHTVGPNTVFALLARLLRWLVSVLLSILCIAILDHFLPDHGRPWAWITPGTTIVLASWVLSTLGFDYYVTHIATYHKTYGVLGGFVVLMVWIYILALIALVGAEINSELDKVRR
jgi:membrane protein